jgi:hypothetical protein
MLTKRIVPALLSLFAWCLTCAAQTTVVDVKDESTVKCPVRMSGIIELTESEGEELVQGLRTWVNRTSFASTLSATNLSNVPILAMVTFTSIGNSMGPLVGENRLLDAFFDHAKEIAPGQTWTKKRYDNGVMSVPVPKGAVKHAPAAWSQVIFVQFADGNTCGDLNDRRVTSLMETRAHMLQALKKIDDAAKIGESEFLKALADKSMDGNENADGILNYVRNVQKEKGSTAAIEYIRSVLDVVASR